MVIINKIQNEPSQLNQGEKIAHVFKEAVNLQRTYKGHSVLAIDPKKLKLVTKKYRPDAFQALNKVSMTISLNKNISIKVKNYTAEKKENAERKPTKTDP